jgi:hypothetical protein
MLTSRLEETSMIKEIALVGAHRDEVRDALVREFTVHRVDQAED